MLDTLHLQAIGVLHDGWALTLAPILEPTWRGWLVLLYTYVPVTWLGYLPWGTLLGTFPSVHAEKESGGSRPRFPPNEAVRSGDAGTTELQSQCRKMYR